MSQQPPTKRQKFTVLAEKYRHPVGGHHKILEGSDPLKSGLTPLTGGPFNTTQEQSYHDALVEYQRERFHGFTAAELHDLEALGPLSTDYAHSFIDSIPIHAMWQKSQWMLTRPKHLPNWPLRRGRPGYWDVSNDMVWKAMTPALRLASLFLKNAHTWGWWDGLFNSRYTRVPDQNLPPQFSIVNLVYEIFKLRPASIWQHEDEVYQMSNNFLWVADNIEFSLFSGYSLSENGTPIDRGFCYGVTSGGGNTMNAKVWIQIAFEIVEPLLRPMSEYTYAERMIDNFRLAAVILHETTHAMWMVIKRGRQYRIEGEPYFDNECLQELGFSIENALFGGLAQEVVCPAFNIGLDSGLPAAGIFQKNWNRVTESQYSPHFPTLLSTPVDWMMQDFCPIPVEFFKALHHDDFWSGYQKSYGAESTHMGPKLVGIRFCVSEAPGKIVLPGVLRVPFDNVPQDQLMADPTFTLQQVQAIDVENARRTLAARIHTVVSNKKPAGTGFPVQISSFRPTTPFDAPIHKEPERIGRGECPRYDEIRRFMCGRKGRRDLALDTMNFVMPEHTMLGYIVDNGTLKPELQPDEWRNFLVVAHHSKELFSYAPPHSDIASGQITRIAAGWPTNPPLSHPKPPGDKPSNEVLACFRRVTEMVENHCIVFGNGFLDHDLEEFRWLCNKIYMKWPGVRVAPEMPGSGFERELFERVIWWGDREDRLFKYGPKGVIRKLLPGFVPLRYTKRKRDAVSDVCTPS